MSSVADRRKLQLDALLARMGSLYTLEDILKLIDEGKMQSFASGDTWAVTQVHEFPRRKVVDIFFVVGDLADAYYLEAQITEFAKSIGATMLRASGRDGWLKRAAPNWKPVTFEFVKEL